MGIILQFLFFSHDFVFCCLMSSVPLFRWLEHGCCVSVSLGFFIFFVSGPFTREVLVQRNCCVCVKLFQISVT